MGKHKYNLHILKLSSPQSSKIAPMETIQNYIYMLLFVSSDIKKGQKSNIFGSLFKNIRTLSLFEIHYIKYSIVYGTHFSSLHDGLVPFYTIKILMLQILWQYPKKKNDVVGFSFSQNIESAPFFRATHSKK